MGNSGNGGEWSVVGFDGYSATSSRFKVASFWPESSGDKVTAAESPIWDFKHPSEYPQGNNSSRNESAPFKTWKYPSLDHYLFLPHLPTINRACLASSCPRWGNRFDAHDCAQRKRGKPCWRLGQVQTRQTNRQAWLSGWGRSTPSASTCPWETCLGLLRFVLTKLAR